MKSILFLIDYFTLRIEVKEELDKPFLLADRIKKLQKEKAKIDSELDLDKQEVTLAIEESQEIEEKRDH